MKNSDTLLKVRKFLAGDTFSIILFILAALIIIFNLEIPGSVYLGILICGILIVSDDLFSCILPSLLLISFVIRNKDSYDDYMHYLWVIPIVVFAVLFHIIAYRKVFSYEKGELILPMCLATAALVLGGVGSMTWSEYMSMTNLSYMFALGPLIILVYIFIGGVLRPGKNYTEHMDERLSKVMITVSCYLVFSVLQWYLEHLDEFLFERNILAFQWRNNACTILMLAMPFTFYMATKKNFAYISVAFLSYGAIVFTGSRGGLLFGAVELMILIVYFAVTDKKHRKPLLIIIGVIFAAGICASPKLVHLMRYTLERFTSYNENFRRLGLIKRSFEDFLSNPLTGRGIGYMGNRDLHPSKAALLCWYHSSVPQVIGSFGVLGILAYGYQFFCRIRFFVRRKSLFSKTVFFSFIGLELMSLVNPGIFAPAYLVIITIFFAVVENYEPELSEQVSEEKERQPTEYLTK